MSIGAGSMVGAPRARRAGRPPRSPSRAGTPDPGGRWPPATGRRAGTGDGEAMSQRRTFPSAAEVASSLFPGSIATEPRTRGMRQPSHQRAAGDIPHGGGPAAGGEQGAVGGERQAPDPAAVCRQRRESSPVGGSPEYDLALPARRGHGAAVRLHPTATVSWSLVSMSTGTGASSWCTPQPPKRPNGPTVQRRHHAATRPPPPRHRPG
jgi:hypothetical protein